MGYTEPGRLLNGELVAQGLAARYGVVREGGEPLVGPRLFVGLGAVPRIHEYVGVNEAKRVHAA